MLPIRDRNPRHSTPVLTWAVLAINILVFLYQVWLGETAQGLKFIYDNAFIPAAFFNSPASEWHTLFTSAFMHGGLVHLFGNMIFLIVFADNVEDRLGKVGFALFYLGGAVFATLLHGLFEMRSDVPLVGASGAISAVLGAYMVYYPRQQVQTFILPLFAPWLMLNFFVPVRRFFLLWLPAWIYIGYWASVQLWEATLGASMRTDMVEQQVAWWAHIGGFLFGSGAALLGAWWRARSTEQYG